MPVLEPKVPHQVQKQADEADKLLKEKEEAGKTKPDENLEGSSEAPEEKPAEGESSTPEVKDEGYEQKYKVLKGKYDKEVKRNEDGRSPVETLQERLEKSEKNVVDLTKRTQELVELLGAIPDKPVPAEPKAKAKTPPSGPVDFKSYLTEEELGKFNDAGYDNDDLEMLALFAQRITDHQVEPLAKNVQSISKNATISKVQTFWDAMEKAIPDREKLEEEKEFDGFMLERAPYQNVNRQEVLMNAVKRLDLKTVIEIYDSYQKFKGVPKKNAKKDLKGQVEPGSGQTTTKTPPKDGKIWTPKLVQEFYQKWALNKIPDAEAVETEKDIQLARDEGRYQL